MEAAPNLLDAPFGLNITQLFCRTVLHTCRELTQGVGPTNPTSSTVKSCVTLVAHQLYLSLLTGEPSNNSVEFNHREPPGV